MRKPVVDYRELSIKKLTSPQFSHLLLLLGWVAYFALYFITENLIPRENCYVVHSWLDDVIPFCEIFVIPYVFWYALIVISLGYFALYNVDSFKKLQIFIMITQGVAMAIYIAFPNMQDLRPVEFARDNLLTRLVGFLYAFDTDTNVCPSLHVAYSIGIASVWLKEKGVKLWWKLFVLISVILICLSTAFIKQHSILDAFAAIPVCVLAELVVYRKRYFKKFLKSKE